MNNLMPEQRADKNGKVVVRHVKANGGSKLSMASIPAPSLVGKTEPPDEVIKRELMASTELSEMAAQEYVTFLDDKGETTKRIVADALMARRDDGDTKAIVHVLTVAMEAGVIQLAVSDINFMRKVADTFPADGRMSPQRAAFNVVESTFRDNFKLARFRGQINDIDYLKHAEPFRAGIVSRLLDVKDSVSSSYEEREQDEYIQENLSEFIENLSEGRRVAVKLGVWGINPTARELLGLFRMVKECDFSLDAAVAAAVERKRFDAEEIRAILTTAPALSQGAI